MAWRKWLVRGLVFTAVGALTAAVWLYQRWTSPAVVRSAVLNKLTTQFPGAHVSVESARMRLLGGIAVSDFRMARRDDLDKSDFVYVPSATVHLDKEQILDGKLPVRKVELWQPRLRILRTSDGRWNLTNLLAPPDLSTALPTVVIQEGTVLLEDRQAAPGVLPLEIKDVYLVLVNDPLRTVRFEGTGKCELAGPVRLTGWFDRATQAASLSLEASALPVGPALVQRAAYYHPGLGVHARQLEGTGKLKLDLAYHPGSPQPWSHDLRLELTEGRLQHARLPFPLEQLQVSLRCLNGQIPLVQAQARVGPTRLGLTIKDFTPSGGDSWENQVRELELKAEGLAVTPELFAALPASVQEFQREYEPSGTVDATYRYGRENDGRWVKRCQIAPRDGRAVFRLFRYPLEQITGTIEQVVRSGEPGEVNIEVAGKAGSSPVFVKGTIKGERPGCAVTIDVWGENVPIDDQLIAALPPKLQDVARSFNPSGRLGFKVYARRGYNDAKFKNQYILSFREATVRYEKFLYPLEEVAGVLEVQPDHWEAHDFRGTHKGGEVRAQGRSSPAGNGEVVEIGVRGSNILLDEELQAALRNPEMAGAWKALNPSGRTDFEGTISFLVGRTPEIDLTVRPKGASIQPTFFRYRLDDLYGDVHYANRKVDVKGLTARHGSSVLSLPAGTVYLKPAGGYYAKLDNLQGSPLVPDADLLRALPNTLRTGCTTLRLRDPLAVKTLLIVDTPPEPGGPVTVYWDGTAVLQDATLQPGVKLEHVTGEVSSRGIYNPREQDRPALPAGEKRRLMAGNFFLKHATLFDQPFQDVHSQFEVFEDSPEIIRLPGLHAKLFGGEVYGPLRVELGPAVRYELNLTASQLKLEEFGRHNLGPQSEFSGTAAGRLYLAGQGSDPNSLRGSGSLDVPSGKMYNLPLLLDLLKFLGLRLPDRTAFEEAHARFELDGSRVRVQKLNLYGNSVSLRGQGDVNLDRMDIDMDFHVDWARFTQILSPGVRKIPETVSNQLLRINMKGPLSGKKEFRSELVPLVTDPVKRVMGGREN